MSYWFEVDKGGEGVMLMRTHNGKWALTIIHSINGKDITELDGDTVQAILDTQRDTQWKIEMLLTSWEVVTFYPDSAPAGWNRRRIPENA
jgi:hypothetical protein